MWLDVFAFGALAVLAILGMFRGTIATAMKIVSLITAYVAAVFGSQAFGGFAGAYFAVPKVFGMAVAGMATFVFAYFAMGGISFLVVRWEKQRNDGDRSNLDRAGGFILGGLQGAVVLLLVGWLGLLIQAGQSSGTLDSLPDMSGSTASTITQTVVETGADAVLDEDQVGARAIVKAAVRPTETLERVEKVINSPRMRTLSQDMLFWSYVEHGAVDVALNQASFLGIAYDESFRKELHELGLINEGAAMDSRLFRADVEDVLVEIGPRIHELKNDQDLKDLMADPAIVQAVADGNTFWLLRNPKFRAVVSRVLDGEDGQEDESVPASADEGGDESY